MNWKRTNEQSVSLTYTDIVVKMVAQALRQHPVMDVWRADNEIRLENQGNVGIAVSAPQGLTVPVIHDADHKGVPQSRRNATKS